MVYNLSDFTKDVFARKKVCMDVVLSEVSGGRFM